MSHESGLNSSPIPQPGLGSGVGTLSDETLRRAEADAAMVPPAPLPPGAADANAGQPNDDLFAEDDARRAEEKAAREAAAEALLAYRLNLLAEGYRPVPISSPALYDPNNPATKSAGKAPWIGQWYASALTAGPRGHRDWVYKKDDHTNTGLLCSGLRAIDIDIDDPAVVAQVRDLALLYLGVAPERFRDNSARITLLYRAAEGEPRKRVLTSRSLKNGEQPARIEVLGAGQQFVCAGVHPSGVVIKWRHGAADGPGPREALVAITEAEIDTFLAECVDVIDAGPGEDGAAPGAAMPARPVPVRDPVIPFEIIREIVLNIGSPTRTSRDDWLSIAGAIHFESGGSDEGLSLFIDWSLTNPVYSDQADAETLACEKLWGGLEHEHPGGATVGKLMHHARLSNGKDWRPEGWDDAYWRHRKADAGDEFPAIEDAPAGDAPRAAAARPGAQQVAAGREAAGAAGRDGQGDEALQGQVLRPADLTEDGIALRLAAKYADRLRYVKTMNTWFIWNGVCWEQDKTGVVFSLARVMCRALLNATEELRFGAYRTFRNVELTAQSDKRLKATAEQWDRHPMLLATPAGTVDLTTGELREARPDEYLSRLASVAPAPPGTPCPIWGRFLAEATGEDAALIRYLQTVSGYFATGDISEDALFFAYGPGGNGKSVFLTVLDEVLGAHAVKLEKDTLTAARGSRHTADLAMLAGSRLASVAETEKGVAWNESLIKALTGRDKITARHLYQDYVTFKPTFKILVIGNHKPVLKSVDDAMRRRMHLIPFIRKPRVEDRKLPDKLRAEYPAILRWIIDGCLVWQRDGLVQPPAVLEATRDYLAEQDTFGRWFDECCELDPTAFTPTDVLLGSFNRFAHGSMTDAELADRLKPRNGVERGKGAWQGKVKRGYHGIRVTDADDFIAF